MESLLEPKELAIRRFRQHPLGDVQVVAIVGVNQDPRLRSHRSAHGFDDGDIAPRARLQRHVPGAAPDLDLEGTVVLLVALARVFGDERGPRFVRIQTQVVHVERGVITRDAQRSPRSPHPPAQPAHRLAPPAAPPPDPRAENQRPGPTSQRGPHRSAGLAMSWPRSCPASSRLAKQSPKPEAPSAVVNRMT